MADQQFWNESDAAFVRRQVAPPEVTDQEFRLFIHLANTWKLDPLAREIYITKYGSGDRAKAQIFVGLAGLLKIANRGGKLDGCEATCTRVEEPLQVDYTAWENGSKRTKTYTRPYQYVARAVVYKKGCAYPFVAEVAEQEYSTAQNLWVTKPQTMLKKVATCQALRLAFALSGLYDEDEFGDRAPVIEAAPDRKQLPAARPAEQVIEAEAREVVPVAAKPAPAAAQPTVPRRDWQRPADSSLDALMATFRTTAAQAGYATRDDQHAWLLTRFSVGKLKELSTDQWAAAIRELGGTWPPMADAEEGEAP